MTRSNLPKPNPGNLQGSSKSVGAHSEGTESYKSSPGENSGSLRASASTDAGTTPQLERTVPNAGIHQSGNNERGGQMTKNYDSSVKTPEFRHPGFDELKKKQDSAPNAADD